MGSRLLRRGGAIFLLRMKGRMRVNKINFSGLGCCGIVMGIGAVSRRSGIYKSRYKNESMGTCMSGGFPELVYWFSYQG